MHYIPLAPPTAATGYSSFNMVQGSIESYIVICLSLKSWLCCRIIALQTHYEARCR